MLFAILNFFFIVRFGVLNWNEILQTLFPCRVPFAVRGQKSISTLLDFVRPFLFGRTLQAQFLSSNPQSLCLQFFPLIVLESGAESPDPGRKVPQWPRFQVATVISDILFTVVARWEGGRRRSKKGHPEASKVEESRGAVWVVESGDRDRLMLDIHEAGKP